MSTARDHYTEHRPCSIDEYHADTDHDSPSSLSLFRASPKLYYHRRITGKLPTPEPTREMLVGTATHTAILEPELIDDLFAVPPAAVLASDGSRRGKAYDAWADQAAKLIVTQAEADAIRWMIDAVHAHPVASRYLAAREHAEYSLFWRDETVAGKARFDALSSADRWFMDLKTTSDPGPAWSRRAARLGVHCQAAWYSDGFRRHFGVRPTVLHVVVGSTPPYDCVCWTLDSEAIREGAQENARTVAALRACLEGRRPWLHELSHSINTLPWTKGQGQWR